MYRYTYAGTIARSCYRKSPNDCTIGEVVLYNRRNEQDIAPAMLEVSGGLADYLKQLGYTDDEERYITCVYGFGWNLNLDYVLVPAKDSFRPAKVIANDGLGVRIFGPAEHITTDNPPPMSEDAYRAWIEFRNEYSLR
jgi:hypothetical protein